jgi:hypothetical protein
LSYGENQRHRLPARTFANFVTRGQGGAWSLPMTTTDVFGLAMIVIGLALMLGANQEWRWLVDPPEAAWFFYSQSFLKKFFGKKNVILITYVEGVLIVAGGVFSLLR